MTMSLLRIMKSVIILSMVPAIKLVEVQQVALEITSLREYLSQKKAWKIISESLPFQKRGIRHYCTVQILELLAFAIRQAIVKGQYIYISHTCLHQSLGIDCFNIDLCCSSTLKLAQSNQPIDDIYTKYDEEARSITVSTRNGKTKATYEE